MKKIVFRFWMINVFISILLFVIYRIVISQTEATDGNFLQGVLEILDIALNLIYSAIYLLAITLFSCTIFLNLKDSIRNNFYLSLTTFLGIPLFCVIFIVVTVLTDNPLYHISFFRNLLIFSVTYLFLTALQFSLFRRRVSSLQLSK